MNAPTRLTPLLLLAAALGAGCVTKGTHQLLQDEHEATRQALAQSSEQVADFEKRTADYERQVAEHLRQLSEYDLRVKSQDLAERGLQEALAEEQRRAGELSSRVSQLEGSLAGLVKDRSKLQASVTDMSAALAELQKRKEQAEARMAEYRGLLSKFRTLIDAGKLKVKIVDGRMVVVLATDVLFGSGSASLSREGKAAIGEVAQLLASIPKRTFQVEGHTDNVPIATAQYPSNWELAAGRALTVVKTMVEAGMPNGRISAAAFGDTRPASANESSEGRAQNRRIEITIVPDLSTLPGFDELQRVEAGS